MTSLLQHDAHEKDDVAVAVDAQHLHIHNCHGSEDSHGNKEGSLVPQLVPARAKWLRQGEEDLVMYRPAVKSESHVHILCFPGVYDQFPGHVQLPLRL